MAVAGAVLTIPRWQIMNDGQPAAGAKLYTYLSGTATPQSLYTTSALNVARTNPVVADADGILPICYMAAVAYRFTVTDANGATIFAAMDDIYDWSQVQTISSVTSITFVAPNDMDETLSAGPRGLMLQGDTPDGNAYYAVMPPAGTTGATVSCGFQALSYFTSASDYAGIDFETYTQNAAFPYASIKSRVGSGGGSHLPFLFEIGGHLGPNINAAIAALCTCPYDKDTGAGEGPGRYVYGSAAQGAIGLGFAGGSFIWQVNNAHSSAYRVIGGNNLDRVVLDPDQKNLVIGDRLVFSTPQPAIASGFGTGPSPSLGNGGGMAFTINIGGNSPTGGVITMPTASIGWMGHVENRTAVAANRADQRCVITASTTTSFTIQNQTVSTGAALAFTINDVLCITPIAF